MASRATPARVKRDRAKIATGGEPHRLHESLSFHEDFVEVRVTRDGQVTDQAATALIAPAGSVQVRATLRTRNGLRVDRHAILDQKVGQPRDVGASIHITDVRGAAIPVVDESGEAIGASNAAGINVVTTGIDDVQEGRGYAHTGDRSLRPWGYMSQDPYWT